MAAALPAAEVASIVTLPGVFRGRELTRKDRRLQSFLAPVNALLEGGIPRGRISEIVGRRSSGKTSLAAAFISSATRRGEVAAVIDLANAFDPATMAEAGVELSRVLWVQPGCIARPVAEWGFGKVKEILEEYQDPHPNPLPFGKLRAGSGQGEGIREWPWRQDAAPASEKLFTSLNAEEVMEKSRRGSGNRQAKTFLRAAELVLEAGGFGLLVMDFGESAFTLAQSSALRLARMAERGGTAVLMLVTRPVCGTFAALSLDLTTTRAIFSRGQSGRSDGLKESGMVSSIRSTRNRYQAKDPVDARLSLRRGTLQSVFHELPGYGVLRSAQNDIGANATLEPRLVAPAAPTLFEGIEIKASIRRNKIGRSGLSAQWRSLVNPADLTDQPKAPKTVRIA